MRGAYTVDPKVRVDSPSAKATRKADITVYPIFERPDFSIKRKNQADIMQDRADTRDRIQLSPDRYSFQPF